MPEMKRLHNAIEFKFSDLSEFGTERELFVTTHFTTKSSEKSFTVGRMDFFSICLVMGGDMSYVFNFNEPKKIQKNSLIILSPSTTIQCDSDCSFMNAYVVAFTARYLTQIGISKTEIEMMNFLISEHATVASLGDEDTRLIASLIEDLEKRLNFQAGHPFADEIVQHAFRIFMLEIAGISRKYNIGDIPHLSRRQELVFKFNGLVDENFKKERSVKYYAGKLAITPKYLTELVHEATGRSAGQLIDEKLIYELKFLLNNLELSIAQIAEKLNFSDQSVLGKFFKRQTGLSPLQYRHTL